MIRVDLRTGGLTRLMALECETRQAASLPMVDSCESGGTGRRTRLRIWRGNPWGFDSPLSHHSFLFHSFPCGAANFSVNLFATGYMRWLGFVSTHLAVVDCAYAQKEN